MLAPVYGEVGNPLILEGYANDYDRPIKAIEFSLDGGETWTTYETENARSGKLLHWRFAYVPESPGSYVMRVRSVNDRGEASPLADTVMLFIEAPRIALRDLVQGKR